MTMHDRNSSSSLNRLASRRRAESCPARRPRALLVCAIAASTLLSSLALLPDHASACSGECAIGGASTLGILGIVVGVLVLGRVFSAIRDRLLARRLDASD